MTWPYHMDSSGHELSFLVTVFPHIVAAATILFWIHLVRKLFNFSFPLCNKILNSFLTRWGNYSRRGNYMRKYGICQNKNWSHKIVYWFNLLGDLIMSRTYTVDFWPAIPSQYYSHITAQRCVLPAGFTTIAVINPTERKMAKRTSLCTGVPQPPPQPRSILQNPGKTAVKAPLLGFDVFSMLSFLVVVCWFSFL
jgi:hypothetical protein